MKKKLRGVFNLILIVIMIWTNVNGQSSNESRVDFKTAPVLFREGGREFQQLVASCNSGQPGKIVFSVNGKELLNAGLVKGNNRFLLTFPAVKRPERVTITVKIDDRPAVNYKATINVPKKWQIYFVQHSHTDVGYTRPQSEILAEHMRYIDYALDYCDQTDNMPDDAKFRWTCESSWVTREYLRSRPASQVERLKKRIAEGRIEVTGMYANMAEIADENIMYDFLQPLKVFSKMGIPVKAAMQNDVNGVAWCMPDYFRNTGVRYLNMGINETRSIRPFDKPTAFWWEAPSGERMLAFRADTYHDGNIYGLVNNSPQFAANILWHLADLESKGYPFTRVAIQFSGYYTDNSPPSTAAGERVKQWNEKYEYPKLRLSVVSEFFEYVEKNHGADLPVYRNAWLDWWTDGFGSTSRETAEIRKTQNMKQVDEGLFAMVSLMGGELNPDLESQINHISESAIFFDEHTSGADESISRPFSENTTKQWLQKGAYAWEALKKVTLLNEEALARFQDYLKKADFPVIYVMNPMGWTRSGDIRLFIDNEVAPVEKKILITDLSTGKIVPAQIESKRREGAYWILSVNDIPAMGYKALKINVSEEGSSETAGSGTETLENEYYRVTIDKATGSVSALFDKQLNLDLLDKENGYNIGQPVRETSARRDVAPFIRSTASDIIVEKGVAGPVWESVFIKLDMDGFERGVAGSPRGIDIEIRLYKNSKKVEFRYMARKLILTDPEALYVAFPFSLPRSRIVFETIGGTLSQGQQLPGSASDWNTSQNFVAVRSAKGQIVIVSNEAPLWHFSDFNMGKFERYPKPGKPWLYSWVMNNYWFTNFRAYQEGAFSWSYQLTSAADTTNAFAAKFGWGVRNPFPARTFPAGKNEMTDPSLGILRITGSPNVLLVNSRPSFKEKRSIFLHFREMEGLPAEVNISSSLPALPVKRIIEVNAAGKESGQPLSSVSLKPYDVRFIEIEF